MKRIEKRKEYGFFDAAPLNYLYKAGLLIHLT